MVDIEGHPAFCEVVRKWGSFEGKPNASFEERPEIDANVYYFSE
jgi:hypothetical protein